MKVEDATPASLDLPARPWRVLLVPDVPYWICGTIARAYQRYNTEVDVRICSGRVLRALPHYGDFAGHFDVVHFLTPQDGRKSITAFRGRVATVTTVHHVQDDTDLEHVRQCDGVMTASTQWFTRLKALGVPGEKLSLVPYGVDTTIFRPRGVAERTALRARLGIAPDAFVVGFVGKRSSDAQGRKGTEVFIRGVHRLAASQPNLCALTVGPGWEELASALAARGLACRHLPFINGDEAFAEVYGAMDIYWCTSTIEGGPVPVLESMASGVCCLATDVGMVADVIHPGENGVILPFGDDGAFARETEALARDEGRRNAMSAAAAQRIRDAYDWSISARRILPLYEQALRRFAARGRTHQSITALPPWPADRIAAEERALTDRFLRDAENPPSTLTRKLRQLTDSRWLRPWFSGGRP